MQALVLTPGQASDRAQAGQLLAGLAPGDTVLGDKACDANAVVRRIERAGGTASIPSRSCRKIPRPFDSTLYKERNRIERFFGRIKGSLFSSLMRILVARRGIEPLFPG